MKCDQPFIVDHGVSRHESPSVSSHQGYKYHYMGAAKSAYDALEQAIEDAIADGHKVAFDVDNNLSKEETSVFEELYYVSLLI